MSEAPPDTTARLLLGLTIAAGATLLAATYVAFVRPDLGGETSCDPILPDEEQCPDGEWCIHERCERRAPIRRARRGESCHDRPCESVEDVCGPDLRCHAAGSVTTVRPPTCEDPAVQAALSRLRRACDERRGAIEGHTQSDGCSPQEWQDLLESDEALRGLLAAFRDRHVVYFPVYEPRKGRRWSGEAEIVRQLGERRVDLGTARMLLVIGRTSPDGRPDAERAVALRRMDLVMRSLDKALAERAGEGPMLVPVGAREESVPLDVFVTNFAGDAPPIAGSPAEASRLGGILDAARRGDAAAVRTHEREVSRHVIVLPIPCDLNALGAP